MSNLKFNKCIFCYKKKRNNVYLNFLEREQLIENRYEYQNKILVFIIFLNVIFIPKVQRIQNISICNKTDCGLDATTITTEKINKKINKIKTNYINRLQADRMAENK